MAFHIRYRNIIFIIIYNVVKQDYINISIKHFNCKMMFLTFKCLLLQKKYQCRDISDIHNF